ncbi:MAG TPA: thioesterase family protein [Candidatus Dormibacteraeota bacterium]
MSSFARATAVEPIGDGRFACEFDADWFGPRGPHGGLLAGLVVRAMQAAAGEDRPPRSLTVHFAAPPRPGPGELEVTEERRGGRLSTVSARLLQGGDLMALGVAALSAPRSSPDWADGAMPEVPHPEDLEPTLKRPHAPPFARHFDFRAASRSAGWMRFRESRPLDAAAVACLTDAWLPAIFARVQSRAVVPTVDLTVHFRAPLPLPDDYVLGVFSSKRLSEGFWEEDGELWTRDGRLIAQSRQLALWIAV